ncbi:16S rRNA (guanine(966)-N(2))-methyltransferase RsmD [bacterium]|nr:MAG: 16S rRNA (guanine(966)-N(2))-methyltransferase RsmD [bacterium]
MRIESGEARGRVLQTPNGNNTRPTDGRTREMLFNSLGDRIIDARFLDLYAGCGSVGLEALSRGAKFVVFIEQEHSALRSIKANLKTLGWEKRALVWNGNVRTAIAKLAENGEKFEIVFADPPFTLPKEADEVCARVDAAPGLLNNELVGFSGEPETSPEPGPGLLIVQHSHRVASAKMNHFTLVREKKAGESKLSFYAPNNFISINN